MRRSEYGTFDWMSTPTGAFWGFKMGSAGGFGQDRGCGGITAAMGVPALAYPQGVSDRQVTIVPSRLQFVTYKSRSDPRKSRSKLVASAYLALPSLASYQPKLEVVNNALPSEFHFSRPLGDKYPEDVIVAWEFDSFIINVRGEENVAKLQRLHEAFRAKDIAISMGGGMAFKADSLHFVMTSVMTEEQIAELNALDAARLKLADAARATGIFELLEAKGKKFYALGPDWLDREAQEEVIFFLNPCEQHKYDHGWFTVAELQEWADNGGPVIKYPELEAFKKENRDWSYNLLVGLNNAGINTRYHSHLVWFDEAKTVIGVQLRVSKDCESKLASGTYPYEQLREQYVKQVPTPDASATAEA